jgi:hypothetical protein
VSNLPLPLAPRAAVSRCLGVDGGAGRVLAIVVDGRVILAPVVESPLPVNLPMMIQGRFSREAAIRLAERLAP